jgi:hypothetical protein
MHQLAARLSSEADKPVIPELLHAKVRRISANGIVITAQEVAVAGPTEQRRPLTQTWWCLVIQ